MYFVETTRNYMLDQVSVNRLSLHTADPEETGENEYAGSGDLGAYARQDAVFDSAAEGKRILNANVLFVGNGGDPVTWLGFWTGVTFRGATELEDAAFGAETDALVILKNDTWYGIDDCPEV